MSDSATAADPRHSAWVSANAGAGKTYTLANRVTRLLLDGAKPERILCLTFTKAAAAEMAERLFKQLGKWAMLPDAELTQSIAEIGAAPRDAEGLQHARQLFALALETPGGLKIQTIHSFCQQVLARFPLEAGVPPAFRVLDEQTARELIGQARMRVLERAGSGDEALASAVAHIVTETSEAKLLAILQAATGNGRRRFEDYIGKLSDDEAERAAAVRTAHGAPDATPQTIIATFCKDLRSEAAQLKSAAAWMAQGSKRDKERSDALGIAISLTDDAQYFAAMCDALLTKDRGPYKDLVTKKHAEKDTAQHAYVLSVEARLLEAVEQHKAARAASLAQAAILLAEAMLKEYGREKQLRGMLDYDDLILETLRLLNKPGAADWVLYKLDGGLEHILIDEAQDTSPEQWEIVRLLTGEFFAGEGVRGSERAPRTIFAVGDEKQSIFSFQGADPEQFARNQDVFSKRASDAGHTFRDVPLTVSRRSAPEILQFVDAVFASDEAREGLTTRGGAIHHEAFHTELRGRVELWPAIKPGDTPEPDPLRPIDAPSEASPVVQLAIRIADTIRQWTNGKTSLAGHTKPITPGDIMVLMPRREPFASEIIRQLKSRGIAVAGADRIKLPEQIAVMDLIALGRFVLLPEDDLNLAALLRSPLIDISETELFDLAHNRDGSLWSALQERAGETPFVFAHSFLHEMRARAEYAPPYEFYAHVLSAMGMRKRLLARLGTEANDSIDEFLSLALSYEALNTPSLEGFLHWVERGEVEIKRDMENARNEVRVMTVHGAKGLEADIVILPDTTATPGGSGAHGDLLYTEDGIIFPMNKADAPPAVQAAKDAADLDTAKEHRRLLYVALTRARERLYIAGFENKNGVRQGAWYPLLAAAAERIGTPMERGGETIHVVGSADTEAATQTKSGTSAATTIPIWATTAPKPERATHRLIRPSDAAGAEAPPIISPLQRNAARFRRGNLVHALLARLPDLAPAERRDAALRFLRARQMDEAEANALADETLAVLNDPAIAPAFAPGSRAEVPLVVLPLDPQKDARLSGRIDRIAVTDDAVWVIDFKTNRPPPARPEDVAPLYLTQMALYRHGLARVFPQKRIEAALIWTDGPHLMALPPDLLDAQMAQIRTRLAAT
jgi:ATP-dependent helicase/nuclease subunit A